MYIKNITKIFIASVIMNNVACKHTKTKLKHMEQSTIKVSNKKRQFVDLGLNMGYRNFIKDCRDIMGNFLAPYGFIELKKYTDNNQMVFKNNFWQIHNTTFKHFPHTSIAFDFLSLENDEIDFRILKKALNADQEALDSVGERYFNQKYYNEDFEEQFKLEMMYHKDVLQTAYLPLLRGEFTFIDYLSHSNQYLR